jgi:hypothetical protein
MNQPDLSRAVLATAINGEKFLGFVPAKIEDPTEYMSSFFEDHQPVVLENVRVLISQAQANQAPDGSIKGVRLFMALLPIDMFPGPAGKMNINVANYYFISDNPGVVKKVEQLIAAAEANEQVNRAMESGIHLPGRG